MTVSPAARGGKKGVFFTVDALLSLAMLSLVAFSLLVYSQQPPFSPKGGVALQSLARDFVVANGSGVFLDANTFYGLTLYNVTLDNSTIPQNARLVAHAEIAFYDSSCCAGVTCVLAEGVNDSCLLLQENVSKNESWVFFNRTK